MNHLFLFTLSPVQSFISQARKTHDLWAGSQILSRLTRHAAQTFIDAGGKIIYPYLPDKPAEATAGVSNRILGEIESQHQKTLQNIGTFVEKTTQQYFQQIAKDAFENAYGKNRPKPQGFDEQIAQHLDIRWLFYPFEDDYQTAYTALTALAAAMKNTREFAQFGGGKGETGRNCNLDGQRNALFYRPRLPFPLTGSGNDKRSASKPAHLQENNAIKLTHSSRLKPGEGLSAVSLCKRFYAMSKKTSAASPSFTELVEVNDGEAAENGGGTADALSSGFPRTSTIALLDYLEKIQANDAWKKKDAELRALFKKNEFSEELYFEENRTHKYLQQEGISVKLEAIKGCVKEFPKPNTSYYALLIFDGDSMGKWLSGEFLEGDDKNRLHAFHGKLSQKLADFAKYAHGYLDKPYGKAVYAGGDDFLGFINLASLFPVLIKLREMFDEHVAAPLRQQFKLSADLTFSGGVVITHYRTPLHIVLEHARNAERAAKQMQSKNALAITVIKRSGEGHQTVLPWFYKPNISDAGGCSFPEPVEGNEHPPVSGNRLNMLEELEKVMHALSPLQQAPRQAQDDATQGTETKHNGFSDTFARRLAAEFTCYKENKCHPLKTLFLSELRRLLKRAAPPLTEPVEVRGSAISTPDDLHKILSGLLTACQTLHEQSVTDNDITHITHKALKDFLQMLHIVVFLKRQIRSEDSHVD